MNFLQNVNKKNIISIGVINLTKIIMSKEVVVNEETCIGCGLCVQLCPKVFAMQDDGKSKTVDSAGDEEANIQGAIDACPVQAISWKE